MYLSKESLKELYSKMAALYSGADIESQGGTQFVSEIKYFLATDEFQKSKKRACYTQEKNDRDFFVKCVGNVVQISNPTSSLSFDTKNFSQNIGQSKDFDVGSNFFSANAVKNSTTSISSLDFPTRHPRLLICNKGVVSVADDAYTHFANESAYLGRSSQKYALLFLWLNRFTKFNSTDSIYTDFLAALQARYSENLCQVMQWNTPLIQDVFKRLITNFSYENFCRYLEMKDVVDDDFTKALKHLGSFLSNHANRDKMTSFLQKQGFFKEIQEEKAVSKNIEKEKILPTFTPTQTIFYGVPGCGKSHTVDKIINSVIANFNKGKDSENQITYDKQVIRTVFHPDYCNADFVGQIMPKKKVDGIDYEFKPGPLATIIRKAYLNPSKPYFLIIEEINRGNASAIFGETFQLLDRYKNGKHSSQEDIQNENYDYTEGWSKYSINNDDLNGYILLGGESNVTEKEPDVDYDSDSSETPKSAIKIPSIGLHFSTYSGIRLPPNLSLYATMNTSDQNVFTLDNAFQRRWEMKLISNDLPHSDPNADTTKQYNQEIGDTGVKWGEFREKINAIIMQSADENGLSSMEDKRLGGWFIAPQKFTKEAFAEKVLKYLWDDAFKFDRKSHFDNSYITLEDLINAFVSGQDFNVFTDKAINELKPKFPTDATAAAQS